MALSRRELLARALQFGGLTTATAVLGACGSRSPRELAAAAVGTGAPIPQGGQFNYPALSKVMNGVLIPDGFVCEPIVQSGQAVALTGFVAPAPFFPDGSKTYDDPDTSNPGGWILTVNREAQSAGGVVSFKVNADGDIIDAFFTVGTPGSGMTSNNNCAGGHTPWGTWITCEESGNGGECIETYPYAAEGITVNGITYPRRLPNMGQWNHEAVAVDPAERIIYETEDNGNGGFYRYRYTGAVTDWTNMTSVGEGGAGVPDLDSAGVLEIAEMRDSSGNPITDTSTIDASDPTSIADYDVVWVQVDPSSSGTNPRDQHANSTKFDGGEGCWIHDGIVYFTTKNDNRVWAFDSVSQTMTVLYDDDMFASPELTGVDHLIVSSEGNVMVAEDGGDLQAVVISPEFDIAPMFQVQGQSASEITGLAFNPDQTRLYFNSQRGGAATIGAGDATIPTHVLADLPAGTSDVGGGIVYQLYREDGLPIFDPTDPTVTA